MQVCHRAAVFPAGHEEVLAARRAVLEEMLANPPGPFQLRKNKVPRLGRLSTC